MLRTPSPMPVPLERPRLSDHVYTQLLDEIMVGGLPVGKRLPSEHQLAERYGVSRPVLREALRRLQGNGVVVSRQGSGNYVQRSPSRRVSALTSNVTLNEVLESYELRLSLEVLSARLAARHRTPQQLCDIERAALRMRSRMGAGDPPQDSDYAFHRAIAGASGNGLMLQTLDFLAERLRGGMNVTLSVQAPAAGAPNTRVLDEHDRILHAIRMGDGDSAAIAMGYHLDQARQRLLDNQLDV